MRAGWFFVGALGLVGLVVGRASAASRPEGPTNALPVDAYPTRADVVDHPASLPQAPRPGVEAFRRYVLGRWGGTDLGIWASSQHHDQNPHSEHEVGQAWDWGQPSSSSVNELVDWLEANGDEWARRTGVGYLIHARQMRRWYDPQGWSDYHGADPHTSHVHFSFSRAGAMGETSAYRGGFLA